MEQTYIEDIARKVGQEVLICGWLYKSARVRQDSVSLNS
jgi:hypothetical protein